MVIASMLKFSVLIAVFIESNVVDYTLQYNIMTLLITLHNSNLESITESKQNQWR